MAREILDLSLTIWGRILAVAIPFIWLVIWKIRVRVWIEQAWVKFFKKTSKQHKTVLELQAKLITKLLWWYSIIPIGYFVASALGLFKSDTIRNNLYFGGGAITVLYIVGGSAYVKHSMSGIALLMRNPFGKGDFIRAEHPHGHVFEGWVNEVEILACRILTPDFTIITIDNEMFREYTIENLDRGRFHYEVFKIQINGQNRDKLDAILKSVKDDKSLSKYIAKTNKKDQDWLAKTFPNISDAVWDRMKVPNIVRQSNGIANLRIPVRNHLMGLALRDVLDKRNLLGA